MYALARTYQPYLPRIAAVLAGLCALSVFLYGALLLETVAHAAARQSAQSKINSLDLALGGLESKYLADTQAITPQQAVALGFVPAQSITTVAASAPFEPLSLR